MQKQKEINSTKEKFDRIMSREVEYDDNLSELENSSRKSQELLMKMFDLLEVLKHG